MSISLLRLLSRAHYWVNKYILKMRVSSKELFSTLKIVYCQTSRTAGFAVLQWLENELCAYTWQKLTFFFISWHEVTSFIMQRVAQFWVKWHRGLNGKGIMLVVAVAKLKWVDDQLFSLAARNRFFLISFFKLFSIFLFYFSKQQQQKRTASHLCLVVSNSTPSYLACRVFS